MADYTVVDPATVRIVAGLIRKHMANPETPVELRFDRRNVADFVEGLADPEKLKYALRPGTVGR